MYALSKKVRLKDESKNEKRIFANDSKSEKEKWKNAFGSLKNNKQVRRRRNNQLRTVRLRRYNGCSHSVWVVPAKEAGTLLKKQLASSLTA